MRRVLMLLTVTSALFAQGQASAQQGNPTNPPPPPTGNNATPPAVPAAPAQPSEAAGQPGNAAPPPVAPVAAAPAPSAPANTSPVAPVAPAQVTQPIAPPLETQVAAKVNPEAPLETGPVPVKGKWSPVMYGFVEFDAMHDSTQSFNDFAGNAQIADPNKYPGKHARTMFGVRNSRLGFKLAAPESNGIKTTGILEMDFLGNQPSNPAPTSTGGFSESAFFSSPTFRVRHFALKLENPYVDVLLGQYWQLFGWQTMFHPNTVEIQGVPGQVFSRSPQARLSHVFKTEPLNVEIAVAASRPPQRDSGVPDGQGGVRFLINQWKGVHTMGGAGTAADAAAIGFSGVMRKFRLPDYVATPTGSKTTSGWGISTDVLLPIIPATLEDRSNALTLTGSWVLGRGIADLFTGLSNGNTASWPVANPNNVTPAPTYAPNINIDAGLIEFGSKGDPHAIMWQSFLGGIQYYLPPSGKVWVSANYSHMKSNDITRFISDAQKPNVYTKAEWYDANLFFDVTVAARLGLEYAHFKQTFGDETTRKNDRVQFSGWLIF